MSKNDPDFGLMKHNNIDAWDCRLNGDFPHANTRQWAVHVWASEAGPSNAQRSKFRELKSRYAKLWPEIAHGIVSVHTGLTSVDELNASTPDYVSVHLGEYSENSVELVYNLNLADEGSRGYFVMLDEWKVEEVVVAE